MVCVYLPINYGSDASNDEFLYTLGELEGFIESQQFDCLGVAGDFNVDLDRSIASMLVIFLCLCQTSLFRLLINCFALLLGLLILEMADLCSPG